MRNSYCKQPPTYCVRLIQPFNGKTTITVQFRITKTNHWPQVSRPISFDTSVDKLLLVKFNMVTWKCQIRFCCSLVPLCSSNNQMLNQVYDADKKTYNGCYFFLKTCNIKQSHIAVVKFWIKTPTSRVKIELK